MNPDGYPDDFELDLIKKWSAADLGALMVYVKTLWRWSDWGFKKRGQKYYLHTGGWSGNEDLVDALHENSIFWALCWVKSERGGHYVFEVKHYKLKGGK